MTARCEARANGCARRPAPTCFRAVERSRRAHGGRPRESPRDGPLDPARCGRRLFGSSSRNSEITTPAWDAAEEVPFTNKPGRRPVVLSKPIADDDTVLFPRSTQPGYRRRAREFHRRHDHSRTNERCSLTQDGWVILDMAVTVVRQHLNASTFSCREPEDTGLLETIDRQLPR